MLDFPFPVDPFCKKCLKQHLDKQTFEVKHDLSNDVGKDHDALKKKPLFFKDVCVCKNNLNANFPLSPFVGNNSNKGCMHKTLVRW